VAKPRPIAGLDPADAYAAVAARVVAVRAAEVADHADGVLDLADIEALHDMRVATRRLRAALEVFEACFPRDAFRVALSDVKELADALGERRDRDVTIAALEEFASHLPAPDRLGIESLTSLLRAEQANANDALRPYVTEARLAALAEAMTELVAAALAAGAGPNGAGSVDGGGEE
jgi:CHAD domain-containing protein